MKKIFQVLILLIIACSGLLAQKAKPASALDSMVNTERDFASTSVAKGIRPAFMQFIAEDGILFRPTAVKGKEWMIKNPLPPSDKRPVLNWQPTFAGMARAGDLGYTSGPWQFKSDVGDAKPNAFGHFITVWKKQADGTWRFAVDLGISHPEPTNPESLILPREDKKSVGSRVNVSEETNRLLTLEREFSADSLKQGAQKAFLARTADNVRVYREGKLPFENKEAISGALSSEPNLWSWNPEAGDVSTSGDVGYSYGSYQLKRADGTTEKGNYLRIWKKERGAWKVVMDVANPVRGGQ